MAEPVPLELQEALVVACGSAFYYKGPLKALFTGAGVPAPMWDRHAADGSKYVIARRVLGELQGQGSAGQAVIRKLVVDMAGLGKPMDDCQDPVQGAEALRRLRQLAIQRRVVVDAEQQAVEARRNRKRLADRARAQEARRHEELKERFRALSAPGGDAQRRGYDFEELLAALFVLNEIDYRKSYKVGVEQMDGALHYAGFDYLVEAKWRRDPPTASDLYTLAGKVDTKVDSTRGLFISQVTPRQEVVEQVQQMTKRLILMDGQDLALIFEGQVGLRDALDQKTGKAAQEGRIFVPLGRNA